jgi:hypothetical protein
LSNGNSPPPSKRKKTSKTSTSSEKINSEPGVYTLAEALIITAPIRIGLWTRADTLVNNPIVIRKPHNKWIEVITNATQSGRKLKLLAESSAFNDIISLIKEMPFEVKAIPRAARSNNNNLG